MQRGGVRFNVAATRTRDADCDEHKVDTESERVTRMLVRLCPVDAFDELARDQRQLNEQIGNQGDRPTQTMHPEAAANERRRLACLSRRIPRADGMPSGASQRVASTSGAAQHQDITSRSRASSSQTNSHAEQSPARREMRNRQRPLPQEDTLPLLNELAPGGASTSPSRRVRRAKPMPAYLRPTKASAARDASRKAPNEIPSASLNIRIDSRKHTRIESKKPRQPSGRSSGNSRIHSDATSSQPQQQRSVNHHTCQRVHVGTSIDISPCCVKLAVAKNLIDGLLQNLQQASRWKIEFTQVPISFAITSRQCEGSVERIEPCLADDAKTKLLQEASVVEDVVLDCYDLVAMQPNDCPEKVELCMNLLRLQMTASHALLCVSELVSAIDSCKAWMTRAGRTQVPRLSLAQVRVGGHKQCEQSSSDMPGVNHQTWRVHSNVELVMAELAVSSFVAHVYERWVSLLDLGDSLDSHYTAMVMVESTMSDVEVRYDRCCELFDLMQSTVSVISQLNRDWFIDVQDQFWATLVSIQTKLIECSNEIYNDYTNKISAVSNPFNTEVVRDGQCVEIFRQSVFKFVGIHIQITRSVSQIDTESIICIRDILAQLADELKMLNYWSTVSSSAIDCTVRRDTSELANWMERLLGDAIWQCCERSDLSDSEGADSKSPTVEEVSETK